MLPAAFLIAAALGATGRTADGPGNDGEFTVDGKVFGMPRAEVFTDHPLLASAGERARLYLQNVGPNDHASSHVIGAIFDRVYYEGNPHNEWRGMQTVPLGAGSGAVVEFIAPEEGDYLLVDHAFADAQKGALGHIRVRSRTGQTTHDVAPMRH